MFFAISTLFGLPAHALIVHAAVILVPLAAIVFAATCWRTEWRYIYGAPVAAAALVGAIFGWLAEQSGEPLEHKVRLAARAAGTEAHFGEHPEQGETAFLWSAIFAVGVLAFLAVHHYRKRLNLPDWSGNAAYAIVLVPAAIALLTMIAAGHSGATLVWKDVGTFAVGK